MYKVLYNLQLCILQHSTLYDYVLSPSAVQWYIFHNSTFDWIQIIYTSCSWTPPSDEMLGITLSQQLNDDLESSQSLTVVFMASCSSNLDEIDRTWRNMCGSLLPSASSASFARPQTMKKTDIGEKRPTVQYSLVQYYTDPNSSV